MTEVRAWTPQPDPALRVPLPPGLRPHRHSPNQLPGWVFLQHQVWVDYWGNEHEIESMELDYVANVIRFCEERAERIHQIVFLDALGGILADFLFGDRDSVEPADLSLAEEEPLDWLRRTPLVRALARCIDLEAESSSAPQHRVPPPEERQYRHPNYRRAGDLWLVRCFACSERGTENHVSVIPTGVCATCGWKDGDPIDAGDEPEQPNG